MKKPNKSIVLENFQQQLSESLERYKAARLYEDQTLRMLSNHLLTESSTLAKLIGKTPSGRALVRWMHSRHRLSSLAQWEAVPFDERFMMTQFKEHPDRFLIVHASRGFAGIKPNRAHWDDNADYTASNYTKYQVIAFRDGEQIDPALLRSPQDVERDADPTVQKMRGGTINKPDPRAPNIFDALREQIGTLQEVYVSTGVATPPGGDYKRRKYIGGYQASPAGAGPRGSGLERDKVATKASWAKAKDKYKLAPLPGTAAAAMDPADNRPAVPAGSVRDQFKLKLKPIIKKLFKRVGNVAMMDIKDEAQDAMQAGAFQRAQNWMNTAKKIETLLMAINKQGDISVTGYGNPISDMIDASIAAAAASEGMTTDEYLEMVNSASGTENLKSFTTALKANLIKNTP